MPGYKALKNSLVRNGDEVMMRCNSYLLLHGELEV